MNWLQKLCDETGISRYRIHKEVGIPQTTLSTIVSEDKKIEKMEFGTVLKIAKAFDMTTDELYTKTLQLEEEDKMRKFKNVNTGAILTEAEYKALLTREFTELYNSGNCDLAEEFDTLEAYLEYQLHNDIDHDFEEIESTM